jgi:hypothetical protein
MKINRTKHEIVWDIFLVVLSIVVAFIWPNAFNLIGLGMVLGSILHVYVSEPMRALKASKE